MITAGNGNPSISANDITVEPGMKVTYFDIANQNGPVYVVTDTPTDEYGQYSVVDIDTGKVSRFSMRGFGWTVVA